MKSFEKYWKAVKENHLAMMSLCCLLPVIVIVVLQFAGFGGAWLYTLAIVACLGGHLLMMHHSSKKEGEKTCH